MSNQTETLGSRLPLLDPQTLSAEPLRSHKSDSSFVGTALIFRAKLKMAE
ncbi:MAG: hypothetical protein V7K47_25580 [Nostoc sp.]